MKKNKLLVLVATCLLSGSLAAMAADKEPAKDSETVAKEKTATQADAIAQKAVKKHRIRHHHKSRLQVLEEEVSNLKAQMAAVNPEQGSTISHLSAYGPAVTTSPRLDNPAYDGADLYVNMPSVNEDLQLLKTRQKVSDYYRQHNISATRSPVISISGDLEGTAYQKSDYHDNASQSDIDLSIMDLEFVATSGDWLQGLVLFGFDNTRLFDTYRTNNSKVKVDRAYITIGNLDKSPLYASVGQLNVPFGQYGNFLPITSTATQILGETKERAVVLGFAKDGFFSSLFGFKGETYVNNNNVVNNWGANLGYTYNFTKGYVTASASYINNLADSKGLQDTGNQIFGGFEHHYIDSNFVYHDASKLKNTVDAIDLYTSVKVAPFRVIGEYVGALRSFDPYDLSFNNRGAKPKAADIIAVYDFNIGQRPTFVGVGAERTWDGLAVNLPKKSVYALAGTSPFKDTLLKVEYRRDVNYGKNDIGSGGGLPLNSIPGNGKHRNIISASFDFYF